MDFKKFVNTLAGFCRREKESKATFTRAVLESVMTSNRGKVLADGKEFLVGDDSLIKAYNGSRPLSSTVARKLLDPEILRKDGFTVFLNERVSLDVVDQMKASYGFDKNMDIDAFYEGVFEIFMGCLRDVVNKKNDTDENTRNTSFIGEVSSSSPVITNSRPLRPSDFFRGRDKQLAIIKEELSDTGKLMLLNGMGGIGKTEMCRKIFNEAISGRLEDVKKVGWLTYSGSLEQTFFYQFNAIKKPSKKASEYLQQVESYINSQGGDLLLFIDNANEITEKEMARLLKLNCKVLMTSRRRRIERLRELEIGKLEMDDCRILYRQHLNMQTFDPSSDSNYNTCNAEDASPDEDLDAIINMADKHTLAIELLAKQQQASLRSTKQFRAILEKHGFSIKMATEKITYTHNPESAENSDWDKAEQVFIEQFSKVLDISGIKGGRLRIMSLFSLLAPEPVFADDIKDWLELDDFDSVNHLISRGWITSGKIDEERGEVGLAMHPLVSSAVRYKALPDEDTAQSVIKGVIKSLELPDTEIFASRLPFVKHAVSIIEALVGNSGEYANLINHASYILLRSSEYKKTEQILKKAVELLDDDIPLSGSVHNNLGRAYELRGEYLMAMEEYEKALKIFETTRGYYNRDTSSAYNNIAGIYVTQGQFEDALTLYEKALEIRNKVLGDEHPITRLTYNNIAVVYGRKGDYKEALEILRRNLEIFEYGLEYDHNFIALALGNMAEILLIKGDCDEALGAQQKAVAILEKTFGTKNPDTAGGYHNLAGIYSEKGNYKKALEYCEKALLIFIEAFGENHYSTSLAYDQVGQMYCLLGDYPSALDMTQKSLAIIHDIFGENHLNAVEKYNQMSIILSYLGQYDKAIEYGFRALDIKEDTFGQYHYSTAVAYNNLSNTLNRVGEYKKAITSSGKALDILEKTVGLNHMGAAAAYNNMGNAYMHMAIYEKAREYYESALEVNLKARGEEHPNTAQAYDAVAGMYARFAEHEKALEIYRHALEIKKMVLSDSHPKTATTYSNIAGIYEILGRHDEALALYSKVLEIRKDALGLNHADTAFTMNSIAGILSGKGRHEKALDMYTEVLAIRESVFGENHQAIAAACNNIAYTYDNLGNQKNAIEWYEHSLRIKKHTIGENHPSTAITYLNIGANHFDMGDNEKAEEFIRKALVIREDRLGKEHPETASVYHNLACIQYKNKKYDDALTLLLKAYMVRLKKLGEYHHDTIDTRGCIQTIYDCTAPHELPFDMWLKNGLPEYTSTPPTIT